MDPEFHADARSISAVEYGALPLAAAAIGGTFEVIMSAERAGYCKTDPRAYLAGAQALGLKPADILFVGGSAHDVPGVAGAGVKVYWSNRQGLPVPANGRDRRDRRACKPLWSYAPNFGSGRPQTPRPSTAKRCPA
jgi:beta-phosphoglucomutase-like phosphatase (HAD superfamily)